MSKPRKATITFEVSKDEFTAIVDAAHDAHMDVMPYARLMVLAAAGMAGVLEDLNRVIDASVYVDKAGT